MAEVLIIRLQRDGEAGLEAATHGELRAQWQLVDTSGVLVAPVGSGKLSEAAPLSAGRRTIVLVPGTEVILTEPELPLKASAKLAQIVPFALEEQIAGDIEDMHFAVGKRSGDRTGTPVAVVARDKMDAWLAALTAAGINAESIYADTAAIPVAPNAVTLLVEDSRVYVRRATGVAAVLDVDPLIEGLQLALASGEETREHVTLYIPPAEYEVEQDLIEGLREFTASLQVKLLPDGALPVLALNVIGQNAAAHSVVNLLQGSYVVASPLNFSIGRWKYAAILAAALVLLHIGVQSAQFVRLGHEDSRLNAAITQFVRETVPGTTHVDPRTARAQLQGELNRLRAAATGGGLLQSLGTVGEALAQAPNTRLDNLSYRANVLDLKVMAPSIDALDRIQHLASQKGLTTEIQSATPKASQVEGHLQMKAQG